MRVIKFRGINNETGNFVYGWYTRMREGAQNFDAIIVDAGESFFGYYIYDTKTIGQFTGRTDNDGVEIYDGDVVNCELITNTGVIEKHTGVVFFYDFEWSIELGDDSWPVASWACVKSAKVMGNIHQNPELLETNDV